MIDVVLSFIFGFVFTNEGAKMLNKIGERLYG